MSEIPNIGLLFFHFPLVKSGNSMEVLPFAIDFSDNGEITLIETASYTSMGGFTPLFTDSINALTIKKSIPPCPAPSASFSKLFQSG